MAIIHGQGPFKSTSLHCWARASPVDLGLSNLSHTEIYSPLGYCCRLAPVGLGGQGPCPGNWTVTQVSATHWNSLGSDLLAVGQSLESL